jgi:hypothetical protein
MNGANREPHLIAIFSALPWSAMLAHVQDQNANENLEHSRVLHLDIACCFGSRSSIVREG